MAHSVEMWGPRPSIVRVVMTLPVLTRPTGRTVALAATVLVLLYLVGGPVAMLIFTSFRVTVDRLPFEADVPFGLDNFARILESHQTVELLATTLTFTIASLLLSLVLGAALAWLVERTNLPLQTPIFTALVASSGIPALISAISWTIMLNPTNGLLNVVLRAVPGVGDRGPFDIYTLPGLIVVQAFTLVPVTFLLLAGAFRAMDSTLEEAARASGASFRHLMGRVTLPLMAPALISAAIYQFVTVIESFDVPLVIGLRGGIRVLSTQVYADVAGGVLPNYGRASAHAVLLTALALAPLIVYVALVAKSGRFATVSGRGYQPRRFDLGRWKMPLLVVVLGYLVLTAALPMLVLLWVSLQPFYVVPSVEALARISFDAYEKLLSPQVLGALGNTLILATATAVAAMLISLATSWFLVRSNSRLRPLLELMAFAPHAIPGVIIGLTVLLIYINVPLPIYGTIWILVIGLTTQYISLGTRLMTAGVAQIDRSLEEAAEASGAHWGQSMSRVTLPLLLPSLLNGMLLVFIASVRNLSLALILYAPGSVVLSTLLWSRWDTGDTAGAGALGVVMVAFAVTVTLAVRLGVGTRSAREHAVPTATRSVARNAAPAGAQ